MISPWHVAFTSSTIPVSTTIDLVFGIAESILRGGKDTVRLIYADAVLISGVRHVEDTK